MLLPVFGASAHAVATVLIAFMAGLALGGYWLGGVADRRENGLRVYAQLEAGIGLFALVLPFLLPQLENLYTLVYRGLGGRTDLFLAARLALSCAVLLLPATLMGGTLPALARHIARSGAALGQSVGVLYAVNAAGAGIGCMLAAYWLLERVGVRGTTWIAAACNLVVAAVAWALSRAGRRPASTAGSSGLKRHKPTVIVPSPALARLVFWGYGVSGATALACEVIWSRVLAVILGVTTAQSLSAIVVVFLAGLALGGAAGARLADRVRRPGFTFGALEIALGLAGIASILGFASAPLIAGALQDLPSWSGHMVRIVVTAAVVILPPTFIMGMLFPIAVRLHALKNPDRLGERIGGIYAVNTAGSIVGAFLGGFVLVPLLGSQASLLLLALVNVAIGTAALAWASETAVRTRAVWVVAGLTAIAGATLLPSTYLVERFGRPPGTRLVYHAEEAAGTVTVHESADGIRVLAVNGAGEVPTDPASIRVFRLLGSLPVLLHPAPASALVIAFGGGITVSTVERQGLERIDCAEIVPGVLGAGHLFQRYNNGVHQRLGAPPFQMIFDDGRNHVLRTTRTYDVVISDSTHPGTADSWVLYTREFYALSKNRLGAEGIFAQWLPLHGLTAEDYRMILRTVRSVFPHATLWWTPGYSVILATQKPLRIDYPSLTKRIERAGLRDDLAEVDLGDAVSVVAALALDETQLEAWVRKGPINTDDRPYIGFRDRTRAGTGSGLPVAMALFPALSDRIDEVVEGASDADRERLRRRGRSRRHAMAADIAMNFRNLARARSELDRALAIDPTDGLARRLSGRLASIEAARARKE